jgi:hypothetical protein
MGIVSPPVPAAKSPALPGPSAMLSLGRTPSQLLQRSCDCGNTIGLSGKCEACAEKERLQRSPAAGRAVEAGAEAPLIVHQALAQSGQALSPKLRQKYEAILGHDLSKVRIHDGPVADASARAVGANAYTVGHDIVFRSGFYHPETDAGSRLLVHELTHTLQQAHAVRGGGLRVGPTDDAHEQQARAAAAAPKSAAPAQAAPAPVAAPPVAKPAAAAPAARAVQRDAAGAPPAQQEPGLLDKLADLANAGADVLWGLVKKVAPGAVIDAIQAIRGKGIVAWLKDKLGGAFSGIFSGLGQGNAGAVGGLLAAFTQLLGTAKTILSALAAGDCKPLFDAVSKLGDTLGQMAGDAWDKIKSFLAPVGDFFSDLWKKFGAPAVDFLTGAAANIWNGIKDFASQVWSVASGLVAPAWKWLKGVLGIGDGADGQNGILQWVQQKLGEAWEAIKSVLQPVIAPIQAFGAKIAAVLPIDAILNLRAKVHEWLGHAGSMVSNLQNPKGVTQNQASLREKILPAIKAAIVSLGGQISQAGGWVASQIGGLVQTATQLFASIKSNSILGAVSGAIDWVGEKVKSLGDWVEGGVRGLFDTAGQAVAKLSGFVDPVLGVLQKLVSVIGNVVKALPGLVMGPVWALIPACIKDPIKDFIIQHILSEIPIINIFVKLPDIWNKIQKLVLDFLTAVFVNGDLSGAAIMVVRFVLEAAGVDVNLMLRVIGKAIATLDDIMMHPGNFLKNVGAAIVAGFHLFWNNIGHNIFMGLQSWLFASLAPLGVTPMPDFSLGSIFRFVLQVLGLSLQKLRARLEKQVGAKTMGVIDKVANVLSQAWEWLSLLWNKGPAAVWEQIKANLADLGTAVISGIAAWIGEDLIKVAIAKIALLSNPAGAIIELIQTIYKTIQFVVTKMNRILAMADAVLNSIGNIVAGNIGPAAAAVEKALVGAIGTALAFLADWLGISDPGLKLKGIVEKVQAKVETAIDWLIAKALTMVKKLFGKDDKQKNPKWDAAVAAINNELTEMAQEEGFAGEDADPDKINQRIPEWKARYGFTALTLKETEDAFEIDGAMSPGDVVAKGGKPGSLHNPFDLVWPKPKTTDYPDIYLGGDLGGKQKNQSSLKAIYSKDQLDETGTKVRVFSPNEQKKPTGYGREIGISNDYRIYSGRVVGPLSDKTTPGGGKLWTVLNKYGYYSDSEGTQADHMREIQMGGDDVLENLWPLNASINTSAGSVLKSAKVTYPGSGKEVKLAELKQNKRKYYFKITGFSV